MQTDVYSAVTFIQIVVLCVLGIVLLSFRIRSEDKTFNLRLARGLLALPTLCWLAIIEYFLMEDSILCGWKYLLLPDLLFNRCFLPLPFDHPPTCSHNPKADIIAFGGSVWAIILYLVTAFNVQNYKWVIHIGVAAYFCLLFIYTRYFIKKYQVSLRRLEEYYDEDEQGRLKWVKISFSLHFH